MRHLEVGSIVSSYSFNANSAIGLNVGDDGGGPWGYEGGGGIEWTLGRKRDLSL